MCIFDFVRDIGHLSNLRIQPMGPPHPSSWLLVPSRATATTSPAACTTLRIPAQKRRKRSVQGRLELNHLALFCPLLSPGLLGPPLPPAGGIWVINRIGGLMLWAPPLNTSLSGIFGGGTPLRSLTLLETPDFFANMIKPLDPHPWPPTGVSSFQQPPLTSTWGSSSWPLLCRHSLALLAAALTSDLG